MSILKIKSPIFIEYEGHLLVAYPSCTRNEIGLSNLLYVHLNGRTIEEAKKEIEMFQKIDIEELALGGKDV